MTLFPSKHQFMPLTTSFKTPTHTPQSMPYPLVGSQRVYFIYANNTHLVWLILELLQSSFIVGKLFPSRTWDPRYLGAPVFFFFKGGGEVVPGGPFLPRGGPFYLIRPLVNFGKVEICLKFEILKKNSFYKGV